MRRFNFSLEKILRLRLNRERETEMELGKAVGALSALELRIKRAAEERVQAAADRFSRNHGAGEILNYELYILRLDQTRNALLEAAAGAELAVEEARTVYLEASRDRKVLDKLKERRQKEYHKTMMKEETKEIDDISGGRAARKALSILT